MAIRVREERITVEIDAVEAVPTAPGDGEVARAFYPLPRLRKTSGRQRHEFEAIVLENEWVTATIIPGLGGRIISLTLNGQDCLKVPRAEDGTYELRLGDSLGLSAGLEITLHGKARKQSLAPLEVQLFEDEEEVGVILGELDAGTPISWHARLSLSDLNACLRVEFKALNRSRLGAAYTSGLRWTGHVGIVSSAGVLPIARDGAVDRGGEVLGGRLSDRWEALVMPTREAALGAWPAGVLSRRAFYAGTQLEGVTAFIDSAGDTLSAVLELGPGEEIEIPSPSGFVLRDAHGNEMARWPSESDPEELRLQRELLAADRRPAAMVALAYRANQQGDPETALRYMEDAIGLNHEDPLAWWFRAALHRGDSAEDLPNAHFLAPLEPVLRAESFLLMETQTKEPNPLVAPLAHDPDVLVDVAIRLWEAGFSEDFARWIDECLRHREVPMLRYLLADALLVSSRMAVEAAQHVAAVAKTPINPPYPWRPEERAALYRLAAQFPDDARIAELRTMMDEFAP